MRILITGGAGFIGSNFICYALEKGYKIINVDKLTYAGNLDNLESYQQHPNYIFYQEDICNSTNIESIIFKHAPDIIIHMAAESHVDRSIDSPDEFIHTNVNGTHSMLKAALKYYNQLKNEHIFRFVHLSTDEVYGALGKNGKFDETTPYQPNSPYSASKAASDHLVRAYNKTYKLPTIIVNSSNNYGPKQYSEKLIPLTILKALQYREIPLYGNGQQVRDWLYVQDHVDALVTILLNGQVGESYCIGSDNEITNFDLVTQICNCLNNLKPLKKPYNSLITYVRDRPAHDFRYATNASKIKNHTEWVAKTNFDIGLNQTILWYIDHFEIFQNKFIN